MIAAFLNYLLHPVLGRVMSVQDFGEFQTLLQLFNNLMFLGVFGTIVLNISTNTDQQNEQKLRENMEVISALKKFALIIAVVTSLTIIAGSHWLREFFHFESIWPFVMLAPAPIIAMHGIFRKAYLRSQLRFTEWTLSSVIVSFVRLLSASLLVYIGWRSFGAITGLIIAMFAGYLFTYARSRAGFRYLPGIKIRLTPRMKREIKYGLLILSVSLATTAMATVDVLIIKHYFSPTVAGEYSAAATIARIVIYAAGPVAVVLTPNIKIFRSPIKNRFMLRKGLRVVSLVGGFGLLIFVIWPDFMLNLLMGTRYSAAADLLPYLASLMLIISLNQVFVAYHLALRHYFLFVVCLAGVGTALVLSILHHATPLSIIYNFIIGEAVISVLLAIRWIRRLFFCPKHESVR